MGQQLVIRSVRNKKIAGLVRRTACVTVAFARHRIFGERCHIGRSQVRNPTARTRVSLTSPVSANTKRRAAGRGIYAVVDIIRFQRFGDLQQVGFPFNISRVNLCRTGRDNRNRRQEPDDGDHDQKLNQRKRQPTDPRRNLGCEAWRGFASTRCVCVCVCVNRRASS